MAELKQNTIMLTGANGRVGIETLKCLNELWPNSTVRILVHGSDKKTEEKLKGFNVEKFILKEGEKEDPSLYKGIKALFIIPPPVQNRTILVKNILAAAKQAKVPFILTLAHLSVRQVNIELSRSFKEIEEEIKKLGIPHCFLHSEIFMDTFLDEAQDIKTKDTFSCNIDADARFNPIAAQDIGNAAAAILASPEEHEETRYTLTGPAVITMTQAAETFSKVLQKDVKYMKVSPKDCIQGFMKHGASEWFAKAMTELEESISKGENDYVSGDFAKLLGRDPMRLDSFIQDHKNCFV